MATEHSVRRMSNLLFLCDTFAYLGMPGKRVKLNLYHEEIRFFMSTGRTFVSSDTQFAATPHRVLKLDDLAGSSICKSPKDPVNAFLTLYIYAKEKTKAVSEGPVSARVTTTGNVKRKRLSLTLVCDSYKDFKQNLNKVNEWHVKLDLLLKNDPIDFFDDCVRLQVQRGHLDTGQIEERIINRPMSTTGASQMLANRNRRPYLVLINPNSGSGKARLVFYEHVVPVWSEANVSYVVFLTTHQNHAREYIMTADLAIYRGILVVSGDGLVYEVINGLMSRADWQEAIKVPINQLPGGSANALACCTAHLSKETFQDISLEKFASSMAFYYSKAEPEPLDLMTIQLCNKEIVHSFLTVEWAFIADVDLESEKYRYLGGMRFTVGAVLRLLSKHSTLSQ